MVSILFVCTGNICRSPLAEGIMRKKLEEAGIPAFVDSCGFESFHVGDQPDRRAQAVARRNGIDISAHRGRLFKQSDFDRFDRIFVMDSGHYRGVMRNVRSQEDREKVDYVLNVLSPGRNEEVMDPWYHDERAFESVYVQLDAACSVITEQLTNSH